MAFDFPNSPSVGQRVTGVGGIVYVWDGVKWASNIGSVTAQSMGDVGRNLIHNPLFNVAQRGAGPWTTSVYTLDRWVQGFGAGDACSSSQVANNDTGRTQIGDEESSWLYDLIVTGAAGAANYVYTYQGIENVRRLAGKTVTVSFYANSSVASFKVGVSIDQHFGTGGSPSATVIGNGTAITLSGTAGLWARYSATFVLPSITGKTLGTSGDSRTYLNIWFSSGATSAARAGSIGVQSGTVNLWGVQLEIGSVATPLEKPDPRYDLANCQRFYEYCKASLVGYGAATMLFGQWVHFMQQKRAIPTIVVTGGTASNATALTGDQAQVSGFRAYATVTATANAYWNSFDYTASADL